MIGRADDDALSVLRAVMRWVRHDMCPMGCVAECALEIACGSVEPDRCHSSECPWGRAARLIRDADARKRVTP